MLGSLKLTVALFAISLVIVLVGTLAQDELNMLGVKQRYFISWIAWLHFDDLFPQAFFPHENPITLLGLKAIPFPGGALVGLLLMVNLVAAKVTRFKVHASGGQLSAGIAILAAGLGVAALVIATGDNSEGLQGTPPMSYDTLWNYVLGVLGVGAVAAVLTATSATIKPIKLGLLGLAALLGCFVIYSLASGFRIGDPGLRIVWQLTKGLGAGLIMLVGCKLIFDKQGGNVLLHLGVALLMFGQFMFGDRQLEQRLSLVEGDSTNTLVNLDAVELTFIKTVDDQQEIVAIPGSRLVKAAGTEKIIKDDSLPVDVKVVEFFKNSTLKEPDATNPATVGIGLKAQAKSLRDSGGTDSEMNISAAYVELLDKQSGDSLGTYFVSQLISDRELLIPTGDAQDDFDSITVGENEYQLGLRFHREVKPYWVQLEDVRRIDYSGTNTVRDYSSFIRIVDPKSGDDRRERVWMNNPLRYRGESFFQSTYTPLPNGKEMTGIQVVKNSGWLIPYVACSITGLGMLAHFLGTLSRFVRRREREAAKEPTEPSSSAPVFAAISTFAVAAMIMLVPWTAVWNTMRPTSRLTEFDFYAAGKIPTRFGGRVMPLDAYARQTLTAMSNKDSLPLKTAPGAIKERSASKKKLSALQWLLEVAVDEPKLRYLPMFRIDAEEVLTELGLDRRAGKLYSLDEISQQWDRVSQLVAAAADKEVADLTFKERKLIELDRRTRQYTLAAAAFRLPVPPNIPAELFPEGTSEATMQMVALRELERQMEGLSRMPAPAIIPPTEEVAANAVDDPAWSAFGNAFFEMAKADLSGDGGETRPGIKSFGEMIQAYATEDTAAFNQAVDSHLEAVAAYPIPGYKPAMTSLERWMKAIKPTTVAWISYLVALVLGLVFFMTGSPRLRQTVWGTLAIAFAIHTIVIVSRIAITGRAPVINIYSSAIFIGWAAALSGLMVERIFKYGMGNLMAAAAGLLTLQVAWTQAKGDTMPVLEAVLDTQFWLSTHVISVSLGYVATLVAGMLGIGYLVSNWLGKDAGFLRNVYRACYGAACFGILFSFVGTVLGGLWADDSWGRFWGWDPKENGALLIVIWNALMLHARWDGMVGARGFSILAIGGNIVTAWSWFGTNELGIGLHSYGFTEGVTMWLTVFFVSQLAIIALALAFTRKPPETV